MEGKKKTSQIDRFIIRQNTKSKIIGRLIKKVKKQNKSDKNPGERKNNGRTKKTKPGFQFRPNERFIISQ